MSIDLYQKTQLKKVFSNAPNVKWFSNIVLLNKWILLERAFCKRIRRVQNPQIISAVRNCQQFSNLVLRICSKKAKVLKNLMISTWMIYWLELKLMILLGTSRAVVLVLKNF